MSVWDISRRKQRGQDVNECFWVIDRFSTLGVKRVLFCVEVVLPVGCHCKDQYMLQLRMSFPLIVPRALLSFAYLGGRVGIYLYACYDLAWRIVEWREGKCAESAMVY